MLGNIYLATTPLILQENIIKLTVHLTKHTSFTDLRESGKNTDRAIIFFICFTFLFMNSGMSAFSGQVWEQSPGDSYWNCRIQNEKKHVFSLIILSHMELQKSIRTLKWSLYLKIQNPWLHEFFRLIEVLLYINSTLKTSRLSESLVSLVTYVVVTGI